MKKPAYTALTILTILNLLNYLDRYVIAAVLTPIKQELLLTDQQLGRLATAFMIGYFVTSPIFGYFGDRFSRKRLIFAGIFVWSLATVFTGAAQVFAMLILARVFVGFGEASYATLSPSWIADSFDSKFRNTALTIFYTAIPVGSALGYILGGGVSAHWGWRAAFVWAGLPGLLLAFTLLFLKEPKRGEMDPSEKIIKPNVKDIFSLFKITNYNLTILGYIAYTFAMGAFAYWGPTFLFRIHHIANETASTFFGGMLVVAGLVGTLVGGLIATAWHKRNPVAYAQLLGWSTLASVPTVWMAFSTSCTWLAMTCLGISMFLLFLSTGPVNTLIVEEVPVYLRASAMAVSIFAIHLFGDFWSPEFIGFLADRWQSLQKAVLVLPVILCVSAFFWLRLARRMKTKIF